MSRIDRVLAWVLLAAVPLAVVFGLQYAWPRETQAQFGVLTTRDTADSVTTSTSAVTVRVPGGRGMAIVLHSPSANTTTVYVKLSDASAGVTDASSTNFTWPLTPGQTIAFNQHQFAAFSYVAASGTPTLTYAVIHR